ncbi:uncharacterized protein LOC141631575 [Silene latifolia]|uniref:uncharacterized protein LOC141631575 n=1 Tax=Silene latifolia TaxID=37657 RepID=UPI003D76EF11
MVFLCETKLSGREMKTVRAKFDGYAGLEVDSVGRSGGLAFWWRKDIDFEFVSASVHYMDFIVRDVSGDWRVTGFYGWPAVADRHLSWQLLRILGRQSSLPWMCIGDFNEILFANEMKGGNRAQWQMNNFREAVEECGLADIQYEGYGYTWDNGQAGEANRQSRIDRAMGTGEWKDKLRMLDLFILSESSRIIHRLSLFWIDEGRGKGAFLSSGSSKCGWGRKVVRRLWRQIARLNEGGRSVEEVKKRRILVSEVADLCRKEEQFWRQRSRALWLKDGDRNPSFFHRQAGQRKAKNHIAKLVDDNGVTKVGDVAVSEVATGYFQGLFRRSRAREFGRC